MGSLYGPTDHVGDAACTICGQRLSLFDLIQNHPICTHCANQQETETWAEYAHDDIE